MPSLLGSDPTLELNCMLYILRLPSGRFSKVLYPNPALKFSCRNTPDAVEREGVIQLILHSCGL